VTAAYYASAVVGRSVHWFNGSLPPAMPDTPPQRKRMLLLEICDSAVCSTAEDSAPPRGDTILHAWPYELTAPLSALAAMRKAAQRITNRTSVKLLKAALPPGVCLQSI